MIHKIFHPGHAPPPTPLAAAADTAALSNAIVTMLANYPSNIPILNITPITTGPPPPLSTSKKKKKKAITNPQDQVYYNN